MSTKTNKKTLNKVSVFDFNGTEINLMHRNNLLGYTFEWNGKHYGNKVELPSKSVQDIASTTFLLFQSFIETLEAVKKIND